ncbi:MAG: hypothetical protein IKU40_03445 [Clostridia bacterium]|nr:hypothetical protein [Clostridia bacterium]
MTKNERIHVFDADGNEIGQTYPKRVQGLIKKGRARFTDESETAIVLTDTENGNTEACPPRVSELCSQSEDIKMFEDTNTAEVLETITPAEETVIEETTETMPEELRRLYDKLDDIDDEIRNLKKYIPAEPPEGSYENNELATILAAETKLLENMLDKWGNIREDTVHMIEAYKKEHAPKENPAAQYVREQIDFISNELKGAIDKLTERFVNDDIDDNDYRGRMEILTATADARIANLLGKTK